MSHTSEKRWQQLSADAGVQCDKVLDALLEAEEIYQRMQEVYTYAGGTNADLAELLFTEEIAARSSPNNVASAEEIAKAGDLIAAMQALHQLYQAADNVAVTQADRLTPMRRMI